MKLTARIIAAILLCTATLSAGRPNEKTGLPTSLNDGGAPPPLCLPGDCHPSLPSNQ
jgi:hypothetical protein